MPYKSTENPPFIRTAEIMGSSIQTALSKKSDELADLIAKGIKSKTKTPIKEAKAIMAAIYKDDGLVEANRNRLVRVMNRGADEVSSSAVLKRHKLLPSMIDNIGGVVQKSSDRYLDRIVMPKVIKVVAGGGTPDDVRLAVKKAMDDAEHYWKNVSNTASSRVFHYGSMLAADAAGMRKCTYVNPKDERSTDFCYNIDGKTITLANALLKAEEVMLQKDEEMLESDYWQVAAELGATGSTAIVKNGLTLPPFHGHCRTTTWFS